MGGGGGGLPVVGRLGWMPFWRWFVVFAWEEQLVGFVVVVVKRGHGFGRLDAAWVCESRRCCRGSRPRMARRGMSMGGDMTKGTKSTPDWGDADFYSNGFSLFPLLGVGNRQWQRSGASSASMVWSRDEDGRMVLDGCQASVAIGCSWGGGPGILTTSGQGAKDLIDIGRRPGPSSARSWPRSQRTTHSPTRHRCLWKASADHRPLHRIAAPSLAGTTARCCSCCSAPQIHDRRCDTAKLGRWTR